LRWRNSLDVNLSKHLTDPLLYGLDVNLNLDDLSFLTRGLDSKAALG
jgi:hypothetical protein